MSNTEFRENFRRYKFFIELKWKPNSLNKKINKYEREIFLKNDNFKNSQNYILWREERENVIVLYEIFIDRFILPMWIFISFIISIGMIYTTEWFFQILINLFFVLIFAYALAIFLMIWIILFIGIIHWVTFLFLLLLPKKLS